MKQLQKGKRKEKKVQKGISLSVSRAFPKVISMF